MTRNSEPTQISTVPPTLSESRPVNFYRLLQISSDADERELQQRISQYYLEAQQNLDHRNAQKRLHFQQMYEIYLPQARHVLLNAERRAEYDRFLHKQPTQSSTHIIQNQAVMQNATPQQTISPSDLATERMMLWQQWQQDLTAALAESDAKNSSSETEIFETKVLPPSTKIVATQNQAPEVSPPRSQPKRSWTVEKSVTESSVPVTTAPVPREAPAVSNVPKSSPLKIEYLIAAGGLAVLLLAVVFLRGFGQNSAPSGVSQPFHGTPTAVPGIVQAEDYDEGGEGAAYSDASTQDQGGGYRKGAVGIGVISTGQYYVGWTQKGEWIQYTVEAKQKEKYRLDMRLMTRGPGRISVQVDGSDVVSGFLVPDTGGFWQELLVDELEISQGRHTVRLMIDDGGTNFDYLRFSAVQ